jgi:hypothetical protein
MSERLQTITEYVAQCNRGGWPSGYHDDDGDEWLMTGISVTRDSCTVERVNFDAARDLLREQLGFDAATVVRFGHFAVGWIDYLVVRNNDEQVLKAVEALHKRLDEDYPVLDEEALSEAEQEELDQSWRDWGAYDFRRMLNQFHGDELDQWPADDLDEDQLWELFLLGGGEHEHHDDGPHFYFARAANGLEYIPVEGKDAFDCWSKVSEMVEVGDVVVGHPPGKEV